jgi:5-methylcytosine-specific restriction endonuclease McrA
VAGTRDRPEVGVFTQAHRTRPPVPWGRIAVGETIWMKWSGGPIVATAQVQGFRQIADCTPGQLRAATTGYKLHDLDEYWASLPSSFFAVVVYLENEEWLDRVFVPAARSRGESWIVPGETQQETAWLQPRVQASNSVQYGRQRARVRRSGSHAISPALRFEVLRRDGFQCQYCGRRPPAVALHADHVIPWWGGGTTTIDNLRTACSDCNLGKGARALSSPVG